MKPQLIFFPLLLAAAGAWGQQAPAAQNPTQPLTVEAIFAGGGISGRVPSTVKWSPDNRKVSYVVRDDGGEHGELWYVDLAGGKPAVLVARGKFDSLAAPESGLKTEREREWRSRYKVAEYHWAPDSQHLLFDSNGQLWFYTLATGTGTHFPTAEPVMDPKFSPDGNRISYVRNHNLCVRSVSGGEEQQLTRDKDENLLNGEVDWVYAEELDARSNYFWSPDGRQIAFLQMNEIAVPAYPIEDFLPRNATVETQKYPKAGDPNPTVRLGVVDSGGGAVHWLSLPELAHGKRNALPNVGAPNDIYIPRFGWLSTGVLWVQVMNRAQDQLDLYFVDARSGKSRRVLSEKSDTWVQVSDDFHVLPAASSAGKAKPAEQQFIWTSWRDGHTHLYLYSFDSQDPLGADARLERQLTHGDYEVTEVEAAASDVVYFLANQDDARQRQLYSVRWDGPEPQVREISQEHGTHETSFPDSLDPSRPSFYVDKYSALMVPHRLSLCQVGAACHAFWESRSVAGYALQPPQFVDFKAEDGTVLHGQLFMPAQIAPGAKVPLIMDPYGGPQGQVARDEWQNANPYLFNQILAREGIATLQVDNRGMGGRGKKFASVVQRNFGETELRDQLAALQQALASNPQLDGQRLGWWGWSYGGYMTLYALTHSDKFVAGFAVAPVTDWHDYDSIYTERYMGLPQQSEAAYKKSSPVNFASGLHGKLIIAHGTGDDNVHMQNTIQMTEALIVAGKPFQLMLYPRKTHSISGAADRIHLFNMIRNYFENELLGKK